MSTGERIVAAARDLCRSQGWTQVTTGKLCAGVGISQPAFYRHFSSLDALFLALHLEVFDDLARAVENARRGAADPASRVRAAWHAYLDFALSEPQLFLSAFERPAVPALEAAHRSRMERGLATIRRDMLVLDPRGGRARVLEQWAAVHGLAVLELSGRLAPRGRPPDRMLNRLLDRLV